MAMTQSVLEREKLLVPVPQPVEVAPAPSGSAERQGGGDSEWERVPDPDQHQQPAPWTRARTVRSALLMVGVLALGLIVQLIVISNLEHRSAQISLFNQFRSELALGTAPVGPLTSSNRLIALGSPIGLLTIPSIGVRQVVLEGTTGSVLAAGPGHLRDTVFPGGAGTSVIDGRAWTFGGPFGHIATLSRGAKITVVTGVGQSVFRVVDVRKAGARVPHLASGGSRLTLVTAAGSLLAPSGVVIVDADKVGKPLDADYPAVASVPASELPLGTDTSTIWALFLWIELLAVLIAGAVWTWHRRSHAQAWIAFSAPLLVVWILAADQITRLLPNLL